MDNKIKNYLKEIILNLKDIDILNSLKKGTIKFIEVDESSYNNLEQILKSVNKKFKINSN